MSADSNPKPRLSSRVLSGEVIRYIVSGLASGATMLLFSFGARWVLANEFLATVIGMLASFVVSFALQRLWVFKSSAPVLVASAKFVAVTATTWFLALVLTHFLLNVFQITFLITQISVIVFVAGSNFTLNRIWTFRSRETKP